MKGRNRLIMRQAEIIEEEQMRKQKILKRKLDEKKHNS